MVPGYLYRDTIYLSRLEVSRESLFLQEAEMAAVRYMRASDEDRQEIVGILREAHAAGRLLPGEFYERLDAAFAAATWGELDDLVADLPLTGTDAG